MHRTFGVGVLLVVLGVVGYVDGVRVAYPGRAFSVTAVMVGVTLIAISDGQLVGRTPE